MTISDLKSLSDRLEGLSGADRETDWRIADAFQIPEPWVSSSLWPPFTPGSRFDKSIPAFTDSLDATVALVERATKVEPIAMVEKAIANLLERGWNPNIPFGPQLARAILRALIAAKIEEAETRALALTELAELDADEIERMSTTSPGAKRHP